MKPCALCITLLAALLLAACETNQKTVGNNVPAAPLLDIRKDSPVEDLVALLGEPQSIEDYPADPQRVKIWIYQKEKSRTDMVAFETEEIPYVDPITGEERMIEEPLYKPQTKTSIQIIKVYVIDGKVVGWKIDNEEKRDLAN